MAKTYDEYRQYQETKDQRHSTEDMVQAAMDQTELLQGVARRVQAFVNAWEKDIAPELEYAKRSQEGGWGHRARTILDDTQRVADIWGAGPNDKVFLLLDDVKVLLAMFPQKDF